VASTVTSPIQHADTPPLVSLDELEAARERLREVVVRTPLLPSPDLSATLGANVRLKCESLQRAGAFKLRGAYNFLSQLDAETRARGVVTYSSGNHAAGVALAGQLLGASVIAVMPVTSPEIKRANVRRFGAHVVLEGYTTVERRARAESMAAETGRVVVPGFDDRRVMTGHGSIGLEIVEEWPEVDMVLVPCGGGGLLSGVAAAVKAVRPSARVVGVEPTAAPSMTAALAAGAPVLLERSTTIADGLAAVRVSELTLAHTQALVERVVTVEEQALRDAATWLFLREKLVVEFSGAAGVAALRAGLLETRGCRIAVVLSGGNIDPSSIRELFADSQPGPSA